MALSHKNKLLGIILLCVTLVTVLYRLYKLKFRMWRHPPRWIDGSVETAVPNFVLGIKYDAFAYVRHHRN